MGAREKTFEAEDRKMNMRMKKRSVGEKEGEEGEKPFSLHFCLSM